MSCSFSSRMCCSTTEIRADTWACGIDALATFTCGRVDDNGGELLPGIVPFATIVPGYWPELPLPSLLCAVLWPAVSTR